MNAPSDDAPLSRNPRAPREPFKSVRDAAETALEDTRDRFIVSLPPPKPKARMPPWAKWFALVALIAAVVRWLIAAH